MRRLTTFLLALVLATQVYADNIITGSKPYTFIPGTVISSSQVNADFDYIINQVNTNAAKNGVNSSITALLGLTTPIAPSVGGSPIYTATAVGGTANAITVTATQPAISSYSLVAGNFVLIKAVNQNTGATTLDVNSTGVVNIVKGTTNGLISLQGGDILVNSVYLVYYDGTNYILLNGAPLFGQESSFGSAATVDLGLAQSHNVSITGTTTITSFGSSANVALPVYYIKFTDALTITYNVTSMITPGDADILTTAGDSAWVEYLGSGNWRINSYTPRIYSNQLETVNGLVIVNNSGTPTTQIDVDADNSIICNTSQYCIKTGPVNLTINAATTGVNALDTGSLANNTWYHFYIISNGVTTAGLASASATSPTMPAGYVYKYRVGAFRTAGAATFNRMSQYGRSAQYTPISGSVTTGFPRIVSGSTSGTINAVTVKNVSIPSTATEVIGSYQQDNVGSNTNIYQSNFSGSQVVRIVADSTSNNLYFKMTLQSNDLFWSSTGASGAIDLVGWTYVVNAN